MTLRVLGAAMMLTTLATSAAHADSEIPDSILAIADEAGVQPDDLYAATVTTKMEPRDYLCMADHVLCPPLVNSRVECIIAKESGGANVANRRGSGAVGVAQYMPSTFAAHAREMGHTDWSPWNPTQARAVAAHDLALGRRAQWTVGGC